MIVNFPQLDFVSGFGSCVLLLGGYRGCQWSRSRWTDWCFESSSLSFRPLSAIMLNKSLVTTDLFPTALYQMMFLILFGIPSVHNSLTLAVDLRLSQSSRISFSQVLANFSSLTRFFLSFFSWASFFYYSFNIYYFLFSSTNYCALCCSFSVLYGRF